MVKKQAKSESLSNDDLYKKVEAGAATVEERVDLLERMVKSLIRKENERHGNEPYWSSSAARRIT